MRQLGRLLAREEESVTLHHIIMQVISDYFQDTAYRLGYKPEDLLPVTREAV
jgi:MinD-like ATPase involved in chromosome partitioning or flagellar assembly